MLSGVRVVIFVWIFCVVPEQLIALVRQQEIEIIYAGVWCECSLTMTAASIDLNMSLCGPSNEEETLVLDLCL